MPRKLDPAIAEILKAHGFGPDACWDCHGTWVVYHRVVEQIAARANIEFEPPIVLEANGTNKSVALCVTAHYGKRSDWSIGEASPANNKNAYPFAMAEKRARDRVVLKLIGLHGLAYSEDEADDFKAPPAVTDQIDHGEEITKGLIHGINMCLTEEDMTEFARENAYQFRQLTDAQQKRVKSAKDKRLLQISSAQRPLEVVE